MASFGIWLQRKLIYNKNCPINPGVMSLVSFLWGGGIIISHPSSCGEEKPKLPRARAEQIFILFYFDPPPGFFLISQTERKKNGKKMENRLCLER